ncbi:MAG: DUF4127 family protein [Acholeplasmataceae bacterium]|jgi:hypothetical protein
MKKIVLLPLDERPCNYSFPHQIFSNDNYEIIRPDLKIMGDKKTPGNLDEIKKFLLKSTKDADGLVIAIDTLLYGGIVPSRLHHDDIDTLTERLNVLKKIKENNKNIKIYAYHLIMRSPQYSSDDEEPDYYAKYGREIFLTGFLSHKKEIGWASTDELNELEKIKVPKKYLDDFLNRRKINTNMCLKSLSLVEEKIIDFLIIPQDDAAEFGWTFKDQEIIRKEIENKTMQFDVYMYPGADEVSNTLLSRMVLNMENKRPLIYIHYPSVTSGHLIPRYEDRMLDTTVKYQILAAGALTASSMEEADLVLFVNAPSANMQEAAYQHLHFREYETQRNLVEFVETIKYVVRKLKKPAIIADVAYSNGGDIEFVKMLDQENLLMEVASYAGWNTSSNTIGTAIPHGIVSWLFPDNNMDSFLASRYIEDVGYCSVVRQDVINNKLKDYGFNYFYVKDQRGIVSEIVKEELIKFINRELPSLKNKVLINDLYMPWRRMFEIGINITYKRSDKQ